MQLSGTKNKYKLGSLFDGSGGFPLSGSLCGVEPRWAAEVEPYPIAVTRERFPNMEHLGDITKVNGAEIEPVDIITFGSPCQDLSVAGKQAGIKHETNGDEETTRSGLFMEAVRIIKEMRRATDGKYPSFALWENVPGAYSSNKGEDFRTVLEELIKIVEPRAVMPAVPKNGWPYADCYRGDGWSLAYRTFDAQYWGVPQRRRRIHLVVDFRGERAGAVLFERQGVRGYFAEGRTPWQDAPADAQGSLGANDGTGESADPSRGDGGRQLDVVGVDLYNQAETGDVAMSVRCRGDNEHTPVVIQNDKAITFEPGIAAREGEHIYEGMSGTLRANAGDNRLGVAYSIENHPNDSRVNIDESGKVQTLTSRMGTGGGNVPMVMEPKVFENHSQDTRYKGPLNVAQTVSATYGMGGNNQPFVVEPFCKSARPKFKGDAPTYIPAKVSNTLNTFDVGEARANELVVMGDPVYCLQGNGIDRADTAGCNGKGWREGEAYTLNTIDRPAVVYAMDRATFNQGENAKYNPEISDKGVNSTLVARGPSAVAYGLGIQSSSGVGSVGEDVSPCLIKGDNPGWQNGVLHKDDKTYTASKASFFTRGACERADCLVATDYKDLPIINAKAGTRFIVRRLTPTECARLQGFADRWGDIPAKQEFTQREYHFWLEVRNTHAAINGKKVQDYTVKQMLTWYNKLHTDSAEYKMWGNGIALPPALYCMQGLVDALNTPQEDDDDWMN